jgi:hypothetical protein
VRLAVGHFERGDDVAADLFIGLDHLRQAVGPADHQLVRKQHRERFVADNMPRAPDRMPEAERLLLAHGDHLAELRVRRRKHVEALALLAKRRLELERLVEIIHERGLPAPGDEDQLFDPRLARFVDRILDQRPIHDRDHFLGDALRRRKKAGAEAGDGEYRLANARRHWELSLLARAAE